MDFGTLGNLGSLVMQGIGLTQQQNAQNKYWDTMQQLQEQKQSEGDAQYEAMVSYLMENGTPSGGGGGSAPSRRYVTPEMLGIYKDYMSKAQSLYQPTIDATKTLMPQASSAYEKALSGASGLLGEYMSPEMQKKMNQGLPASSIQYTFNNKR